MAAEDVLIKSVITVFSGFLLFIALILNRVYSFIDVLDSYYVLFLFSGIIISLLGGILAMVWHFENRKPYIDERIKQPRTHFTPYLSFGILLVIIGFVVQHNFHDLSQSFSIMSLLLSISGIGMLVVGLRYFVIEVLKPSRTSGKT
jgi:peptidoglycan/LPS O-acetylase OafA/YrhL